jgi:hypothetical protein
MTRLIAVLPFNGKMSLWSLFDPDPIQNFTVHTDWKISENQWLLKKDAFQIETEV